jgi:hypothetical protein
MDPHPRPTAAKVFTALLVIGGLATGYIGLSAFGYLVPAAVLASQGALLWFGRSRALFVWIMLINLAAEIVMEVTLGLGNALGMHKLDIAGVAMLTTIATGGPIMTILSIPLLAWLRFSRSLQAWFNPRKGRRASEVATS